VSVANVAAVQRMGSDLGTWAGWCPSAPWAGHYPRCVPEARTRIVIVYGGRSAEHEVSCISARYVWEALDPAGYDVVAAGVRRDGTWVDATAAARSPASAGPTAAGGAAAAGAGLPSPDDLPGPALNPWTLLHDGPADTIAFPVVHGPSGEDGTLQGLFETAGVAYVGAGVLGSAAAMDKAVAKVLFEAAGLPQVRHLTARVDDIGPDTAERVAAALGWPVFVKPANLGSTVGISRATDPATLEEALRLALRYDEYVVLEEAVVAREVELAVLGHPDLAVSGVGEPLPSKEFYDFEDKYVLGTAGLAVPADLPAEVVEEARPLARRACRALRVEGMARVDFFYEEGGRGLLINEINTLPGLTAISMYPRLWDVEGLSAPKLVDALLVAARSRHTRRAAFSTSR
jgi:D-alanine-D-alanine ligase